MRELTPAQHAQIRLQLVLIPVYVWMAVAWTTLYVRLPLGPIGDEHLFRDFAHFYVQGVIANERNAHALYDRSEHAAILHRVAGIETDVRFPPVHGPQISVFFSPLARLPYADAIYVWLTLTLLVYGGCNYAVWKICPRLRDRFWTIALLLLAAPALRFDLGFTQTSAVGLACVTSAFFALGAGRPFLAGLAIGGLAYKPQLGLAAAFVFVIARERQVVLGAIVAAAAQLAVGALYWGPGIFVAYLGALGRLPAVAADLEPIKSHMHSWRAFFDLLRLPPGAALAAYLIACIVTLGAAVACWRARGPLAVRYSALLIATVLVDPHLYSYDLILLMPAFLLLWDWAIAQRDRTVGDVVPWLPLAAVRRWSFPFAFQLLLYVCYMSPLLGVLAEVIRVQISVPALVLLGSIVGTSLLSRATRIHQVSVPARS